MTETTDDSYAPYPPLPTPDEEPVKKKKKRRVFTNEQKAGFVAVAKERAAAGDKLEHIAKDLDVIPSALRRWVDDAVGVKPRKKGKKKRSTKKRSNRNTSGTFTDEQRRNIIAAYTADRAEGLNSEEAAKKHGITATTYYQWRKKFGVQKRQRKKLVPRRTAKGQAQGNVRPAPEPSGLVTRVEELHARVARLEALLMG